MQASTSRLEVKTGSWYCGALSPGKLPTSWRIASLAGWAAANAHSPATKTATHLHRFFVKPESRLHAPDSRSPPYRRRETFMSAYPRPLGLSAPSQSSAAASAQVRSWKQDLLIASSDEQKPQKLFRAELQVSAGNVS